MNRRLFEVAHTGSITDLHQLLHKNPLILHEISPSSAENPLYVATLAGHVDFVKEIIRLRPDFAKEINQDGFSPMHAASAKGDLEIVRELLKVDRKLCRLEGSDKKTPLHTAAIKGRIEVVSEMLSVCAECIEDVTVNLETALHHAVKNSQLEVVRVMVEWARQMNKEEILNTKDELGNTVLHLATWKKQRQVVERLLGNGTISSSKKVDLTAINKCGLTALDVLSMFPSEAGDRELEEILQTAGAKRAREIIISPASSSETHSQTLKNSPITSEACQLKPNNFLEYFKYHKGRDKPSDVRNTLLVIAVLVATTTYQVGISPPGGILQHNSGPNQNSSTSTSTSTSTKKDRYAGISIMGSSSAVAFNFFVLFNSIGFTVSLFMISVLTTKFPLQLELQICMTAMFTTYGIVMSIIAPNNTDTFVTVLTSVLPLIVPLVITWARKYKTRVTELVIYMTRPCH